MEKEEAEDGVISPAVETIIKTSNAYDKDGSILVLGCREEGVLKDLSPHHVTALDSSLERIESLSKEYPDIEFIPWSLKEDPLPLDLGGRQFKFVLIANAMSPIPEEKRISLLDKLSKEYLEEGGILFIAGRIFKNEEEKVSAEKDEGGIYPPFLVYEELKKQFPTIVYQKVLKEEGILALARAKKKEAPVEEKKPETEEKEEPEASESEFKEETPAEEPVNAHEASAATQDAEEAREPGKEDNKDTEETSLQNPSYQEPDEETLAKWKTVRDIQGTTMFEYGSNFLSAIRPYEKEALDNWEIYGPRLHNLFGGTFRNSDILDFRVAAVTNYFKSEGAKLSKESSFCESLARLYAAVFLRQRFPGDKIGLNLYGLYYGIFTDLRMIFLAIGENFTSVDDVIAQIPSPNGTKLGEILSLGFRQRNF